MSQTDFDEVLDECLQAADPFAAAAQYPELREELLLLIGTAQLVRETPRAVSSPQAKARGLELGMMKQRLRAQTRQAQEVLSKAA